MTEQLGGRASGYTEDFASMLLCQGDGLSESETINTPPNQDGVDALTELALNLHWSWNHAADELWEGLDKELWATTQNP